MKDWPGVVEDEVNGGGVEREGSLVDEGSSGEEEGSGWDSGLGEVGGEGEGTGATGGEEEGMCRGRKEYPIVEVEDERNGGGFGDRGRENQYWYDVEDMVKGKGREAKRISWVWWRRKETVEG